MTHAADIARWLGGKKLLKSEIRSDFDFVRLVQEGLPTAVLATGLILLAFLSTAVGLILDTVTRGRREMKLLAYLSHPAPGEEHLRA